MARRRGSWAWLTLAALVLLAILALFLRSPPDERSWARDAGARPDAGAASQPATVVDASAMPSSKPAPTSATSKKVFVPRSDGKPAIWGDGPRPAKIIAPSYGAEDAVSR